MSARPESWGVLSIERALRGGHVVIERGERVLDDRDLEAAALQLIIDAAPAGAVGKCAVDQHDIADRLALSDSVEGECRHGSNDRCSQGPFRKSISRKVHLIFPR